MIQSKPIGKQVIFLFIVFVLIPFYGLGQDVDVPYRIKTIVIDAGHGGRDPGNLGTGRYKTREKDIALDVALRFGGYVEEQFPEIKVVYTRKTDVFIGLDGRAEIANDAKADLFVSIHCNSAANSAAYGAETFALGLHRNKENLEVAMKENSAIFLEDDYETKYEGFDPNSAESIIALTIMQSAYLQQSLAISAYIQKQFKERVGRRDRGVKQAGFLVLRKTTMPSILVELGFLTNPSEEDFLNSENGKVYMASAIFRGFKEYKELVEDPLPEGQETDKTGSAEQQKIAEKKKREEARQDSLRNVIAEARKQALTDSLARVKQQQLDQKIKREAELAAKAKQAARLDSLEKVKQEKLAAYEKRKQELAAKEAEERAAIKAEEEAAQRAAEEQKQKEQAAKEAERKRLEALKAAKEKELEEARQKAVVEAEKERLLAIKKQKEQELAEAKRATEQTQAKEASAANKLIEQQAKIDSLAQVRAARAKVESDSVQSAPTQQQQEKQVAQAAQKEKQRQDSLKMAEIKRVQQEKEALKAEALAEAKRLARQKAVQDSVARVRKAEEEALAVTIDDKQATSPEEAELLFLQLRKKQLEQRIAKLKGKNVEQLTQEKIEARTSSQPAPEKEIPKQNVEGLRLRVQVATSSKPLAATSKQFKGQNVWEYQQGGLYKYTVGDTQDFDEITKLQSELRNLGFQGAFVVAFKDGERIKVSEARELLK